MLETFYFYFFYFSTENIKPITKLCFYGHPKDKTFIHINYDFKT